MGNAACHKNDCPATTFLWQLKQRSNNDMDRYVVRANAAYVAISLAHTVDWRCALRKIQAGNDTNTNTRTPSQSEAFI
ncbi:hypothetical protein ACLKA6_015065 [Drosophila palustris]